MIKCLWRIIMTTGERIKELLKEKKLSQKELAERSLCTQAAMSHYIKGDRIPNSKTLANIATVLGTTSNYLLGLEDYDYGFEETKRVLARNAVYMSHEERVELINLLLKED